MLARKPMIKLDISLTCSNLWLQELINLENFVVQNVSVDGFTVTQRPLTLTQRQEVAQPVPRPVTAWGRHEGWGAAGPRGTASGLTLAWRAQHALFC